MITRGTTAPHRLRRTDRWIADHVGHQLRTAADPLVVDLGFGATPVTTVELRHRLLPVVGDRLRVVGLDIAPERVAGAAGAAAPPGLDFAVGGFELAGLRPRLLRVMNVLRQYDESAVPAAWATMVSGLAPGGLLLEGTCDETGHMASWVTIDATGPRTLTLAADPSTLTTPARLATRLPKALIHRNVPGEPVHHALATLERCWLASAAHQVFGPGQRWWHAVALMRAQGWPVVGGPGRWHRGELTLRWSAVAPGGTMPPWAL